ncbi:hypothetical protein [Acetobacter pasteurianus]|uniref:hypothetical protein n=1 Tax=Acetobacter pasteurianus TaxID=438 RepID=UPI002490F984|nr:hypothetical protein [Acetobacter pasteurianus]
MPELARRGQNLSKVLMVGGPLDGEWRELPHTTTGYVVRFRPKGAPHQKGFYELGVETEDGGEFYFLGFEEIDDEDCKS